MQCYGMRLVAGSVGGMEVQSGGGEEARGYETAVWDCFSCRLSSIGRSSRIYIWGGRTVANRPFIKEVALVGMGIDGFHGGGFCEEGHSETFHGGCLGVSIRLTTNSPQRSISDADAEVMIHKSRIDRLRTQRPRPSNSTSANENIVLCGHII